MALAISLLLATGMNVLALGGVAEVVAQWRSASGQARETSWITTVAVASPVTGESKPESPAANPARAKRAGTPAPDRQHRETAPSTNAPAAPAEGTSPVRFYRFREVDSPAEPDSDWNLDTAALESAGLNRLVFEVFVSSTGELVECTILEPETLGADTRRTLEDRMRQTRLQPALRGGSPVASVRRIEVSVLAALE